MVDTIIVGDGPAGLSAALFLAKNGQDVTVLGADESYVHDAYFFNYLGAPDTDGTAFMETARRQVEDAGAALQLEKAVEVSRGEDGFTVSTDEESYEAQYVILATGPTDRELATDLGAETADGGEIQVDRDGRTAVDGLYAAGWVSRGDKIQAVISAGEGAAAALDILSREAGEDVHDFDVPADA